MGSSGINGKDWPWVVGNLCAIFGGLFISLAGSLLYPDNSFKWEMLNERIPLVDDIEPPKDAEETDGKLQQHVRIAIAASVVLTIILLVLWPLPMHGAAGVLSKGGFTVWIVLEILWAVVGGIVIIGLPVFETMQSVRHAKKSTASSGQSASAGDSVALKIILASSSSSAKPAQ